MDSDFFTDGYADKKELEAIESRIGELTQELQRADDYSAGRTNKEIEEEIAALVKKKDDILHKKEHEEDSKK